jgi:hypothetical protein
MAAWLGVVLAATGAAGLLGKLPGVEPAPYIIRFTEDRPNPLYRRICYTFAWSAVITFAVLNIAGLVWAIATGEWRMRQIYDAAYFPIAGSLWLLGALGLLPRVKRSTKNEGHERRYSTARLVRVHRAARALAALEPSCRARARVDVLKLMVFVGILAWVGNLARRGPAAPHAADRAGRAGNST